MNGAAALIRALEDLGVKRIFGLPGVQNIALYDALFDSEIEHVLVRHEQAAVHMADGYARATGSVGVVFATSGPGATNTVTGIATAYMDSVPVVVITGQVPTSSIGTDAFQEADITTITLPITKHSYLLKEVQELVPAVFEAFYLAASGRPGPVLIDVPGNVAAAEATYLKPATRPSLASYRPTIKGNARQVKAAAELITHAKRPVLLAGGGVVSSSATDEIVQLAEKLELPVVTTLLAKGVIAADHPLFLGQPGVYGAPRANAALQEADVVIAVGTRFSERVTASASDFAPLAQIIHIDIDPAEIGKNIRVDVPIVGDAATVLRALAERLSQADKRGRLLTKGD
ncbi:MAG: acetolactate synthase large subunit, partial [Coriobacteriales bacterium]|nr:acetolactate synthase large subunit [Coriobacteriales bacterium]